MWCAPPSPRLRGKLSFLTFHSFYLFRFLSLRTGQIYLFHQTVLEPRYERPMATFFFKARPQANSFCTGDRSARGCGCAGGCENSRLRRAARGECLRARIG